MGSDSPFRRDLTDQDITWLDASPDTDDTVLIEVLRSVVADVGDIAGKFFETALRLTYLERILVDVDRGERSLRGQGVRSAR